ncbi:MAG: single-stranded-DNA-specific exonuclease RecJ [Acidobacteriota bacterium]|nr:single-stranded-DNA-specific exonuclease RecJ [Acidobacteriota bacterium]
MTVTTASAASTRTTKRWIFPDPADTSGIAALARELGLPYPAAAILWRRGYRDAGEATQFLNPRIEDLHDPFLLCDMHRAVERIREAISCREAIEIHGDYDVDGVTSTVVLKKALEMVGAQALWHIPHRLQDGYGMQVAAVEGAAERGVRLIVSVDNGIRAAVAIRRATELGIDVIVTDHHLPESELPPAYAIVNPGRRDCGYPNKNLCGAGVALKLAHAILSGAGWTEARLYRVIESFLKLVAIATVADIVPLTGENRIIVKHGLKGLGEVRNPGLRALLDAAGFRDKVPNATEVAFRIAPAINASGRMDSAGQAVRMFLTADAVEAGEIARELFTLNQDRQAAERAIVNEIFERCAAIPVNDSEAALVFWGEGWHRGVVGIVASRVMQRYHRPALVLGVEKGIAQGSGRSIEAFHLLDALESMREIFTKFGGHAHAAGLTLPAASLDTLRSRLQAYAGERLTAEDMQPVVDVDAVLGLNDVDEDLWAALERIAPFGMDNPRPVFAIRGAHLAGPPQLWKEKHLKIALKQNGRTVVLKGFGMGECAETLSRSDTVDVAFEIERDWFGGLGLLARECRPAQV